MWETASDGNGARSRVFDGPVLNAGRDTPSTTPLSAEEIVVQRMPEDTLLPLCLAVAMTATAYGLLFGLTWLTVVGVAGMLLAMIGWAWPPAPFDATVA